MLDDYKEVLVERVEPDVVLQLKQPERFVLVVWKVFKYFFGRIARLEDRVQSLENKKDIAAWQPNNTRPGNGGSFAVPAVPPRDREPQG